MAPSPPVGLILYRHPRFGALLIGLVAAVLLWGMAEGAFGLLLWIRGPAAPERFSEWQEALMEDDPRLGFRAAPGAIVHAYKDSPAGRVYEAVYRIDAQGRRVTPVANAGERPCFALFFGGSYTFGEGVEDHETLPARFGGAAPTFHPYNYGFKAYGPQNMLLQATGADFAADISQQKGVAFYVFIDHHVNRLIGAMRVGTTWGQNLPRIVLEDGRLTYTGSFENSRPATQFFYRAARHLPSVQYLEADWPLLTCPRHYRLLAAVCAATQSALRTRFEVVDFYVLLYPDTRLGPYLMPALDAAGVEYLDFAGLFRSVESSYAALYYEDLHPKPQAHEIVARQLAEKTAKNIPE
jgi:hypothetical protein